ncbi:MAG TPA: hypothetical protein VNB86_10130 [Gaiellaceae bacterium]|nr:hypothetical protein [Gaiellaceae bacterium]
MRTLQLVLVAGIASALTALAAVVGLADAQSQVIPANTENPAVVGTTQDGALLAAKDGEWSGTNPMTFTYQWRRCDANGANCANIAGATGKIYRASTADVAHTLRVTVSAKNETGTASESSPASGVVDRPTGATRLSDGKYSIPVASVNEPFRLVLSGLQFTPSVLRSRAPFTGRFRVTDTRGYVVRDAIVLVTGVPLGWINAPAEVTTNVDGYATVQLQPTTRLRLVRGGSMVMFVRARKQGDDLLAGISTRRLVRVRTARPGS